MAEKEERKLSKEELARKATFEVLRAKLEEEGYETKELTMSTLAANILTIFGAAPLILLLVFLFKVMNPEVPIELSGDMGESGFFLILFMILIVVHEIIHGLTWAIFAKGRLKAIAFGFIVQYLTPYCTCKEPLQKYQMILGAMMPTIVLGIFPGIAAAITGSAFLIYMACFMILGGGADIMMSVRMLFYRSNTKDVLYYDHPYKIGSIIFEKANK